MSPRPRHQLGFLLIGFTNTPCAARPWSICASASNQRSNQPDTQGAHMPSLFPRPHRVSFAHHTRGRSCSCGRCARARVVGSSSYQRHGRLSHATEGSHATAGSSLAAEAPLWGAELQAGPSCDLSRATPDSQPADAPRAWRCMRSAECWRSATQGSGYNLPPLSYSAARSKE